MAPQIAQNRPQEPPKTLLQPGSCGIPFSDAFFLFFGPPGILKIVLPLERQHDFEKSRFPPLGPKKHPKLFPKWIQKVAQGASRGPEMSIKIDVLFQLIFQCIFYRFWTPRWNPPKAPKISQKSVLGAPRPPRDARGRPEAQKWSKTAVFGAFRTRSRPQAAQKSPKVIQNSWF